MTVLINNALVWIGLVGSACFLGIYASQRWYKNPVGHILIIVSVVMTLLYAKSAVTLVQGVKIRANPFSVSVNAICAILALYCAVSFSRLVFVRSRIRFLERQRRLAEAREAAALAKSSQASFKQDEESS
jgi:membrane associated rhomboid family serine protease